MSYGINRPLGNELADRGALQASASDPTADPVMANLRLIFPHLSEQVPAMGVVTHEGLSAVEPTPDAPLCLGWSRAAVACVLAATAVAGLTAAFVGGFPM